MTYDALLIVSFGGPEAPEEVMPFLRAVVQGRVPEARLQKVAQHYHHFGGVSPINRLTAELASAVAEVLEREGPRMPVYWGNRFWRPHLEQTVRRMKEDGVQRALAFCTTALSSPPGCRAYRLDLESACAAVDGAPEVHKLPPFSAHPGYVATCAARLEEALARCRELSGGDAPEVFFTAHSIPTAVAQRCPYEAELRALASAVAAATGVERWRLVYQSRSGRPDTPWLEPDITAALESLPRGAAVVVAPFGFVADHMEVVYDLDHEARAVADARGLSFVRATTANAHPRFVAMIRELVAQAMHAPPRACAPGCCE